jgi:hypothetical protein
LNTRECRIEHERPYYLFSVPREAEGKEGMKGGPTARGRPSQRTCGPRATFGGATSYLERIVRQPNPGRGGRYWTIRMPTVKVCTCRAVQCHHLERTTLLRKRKERRGRPQQRRPERASEPCRHVDDVAGGRFKQSLPNHLPGKLEVVERQVAREVGVGLHKTLPGL